MSQILIKQRVIHLILKYKTLNKVYLIHYITVAKKKLKLNQFCIKVEQYKKLNQDAIWLQNYTKNCMCYENVRATYRLKRERHYYAFRATDDETRN